ncbi:hypothetical protein UFOVP276_217 [uncultured Caudovirales phage]|uniref:Uncharacterized protein n=1 Tax=uncultured Caudovirales phage TaxID=2100421 RepID=A0A6J5LM29_9CAUD|nr:hypothetical protein UFOVP127_111 [uncultured Caudovirales phage]CAB4135261.1 hypothetical protein UFOVP276_217 [uncultured Caudovirales phage]
MPKVKKRPCVSCGNLVAEGTVLGHHETCSLLKQWIGPRNVIATTVLHLDGITVKREMVYLLPPKKAVLYAYAQSIGDWGVGAYMKKYGKHVKCGRIEGVPWVAVWSLGNFVAVTGRKGK